MSLLPTSGIHSKLPLHTYSKLRVVGRPSISSPLGYIPVLAGEGVQFSPLLFVSGSTTVDVRPSSRFKGIDGVHIHPHYVMRLFFEVAAFCAKAEGVPSSLAELERWNARADHVGTAITSIFHYSKNALSLGGSGYSRLRILLPVCLNYLLEYQDQHIAPLQNLHYGLLLESKSVASRFLFISLKQRDLDAVVAIDPQTFDVFLRVNRSLKLSYDSTLSSWFEHRDDAKFIHPLSNLRMGTFFKDEKGRLS